MRKIEAELKELIRDYHRMKNRRKRKLQQQHKNGMAETGAQINAACIAVVDAFADSPQADFKDSLSSSSYNDATSHVVSPVTTQQPNVVSANMYNLPKKARMEPPPVLTLQEANELKEQISQLHPGVFMSSAINFVWAEILKAQFSLPAYFFIGKLKNMVTVLILVNPIIITVFFFLNANDSGRKL